MRAVYRICGNQSQPSVQLVEKVATSLEVFDHSLKLKVSMNNRDAIANAIFL